MLPAGETNKVGAAGKLNLDEFEVRLVDDEDREVPVGETGEIVARPTGPNLMFSGLLASGRGDRRRAAQPLVPHRRPRSARRGRLPLLRRPQEGLPAPAGREHLQLRDGARRSSRTRRSRTSRCTRSRATQGEDDVKVTAVLQEGATVTEEELCRWSVDQVPYFAVPRYIEFRTDLPRNPVGSRPQVRAARRRRHRRDLGPRSVRLHVREALSGNTARIAQRVVRLTFHQPDRVGARRQRQPAVQRRFELRGRRAVGHRDAEVRDHLVVRTAVRRVLGPAPRPTPP